MASIVDNQKIAYLARVQDDMRRLQDSLVNLSDSQRAGILAILAAKTSTPVDIVLLGESGDWREAWGIVSAHLKASGDNRWTLGNGCEFIVEEMRR